MTECRRLSDRIPDVVRGLARWTTEETEHLAACADCRLELELVAAVHRVGARLPAPPTPHITAAVVLARLAAHRSSRRRWWRYLGLGGVAAAGFAALLWSGAVLTGPGASRDSAVAAAEIALPELEPLDTAELDSLLEMMDSASLGWSAIDEPTLGDLDADELEQVLGTWEG